ncbi:MAG: nitroreductase family protein [Deltaproteobacteria bacterium]|nr:nitroreductase family protein [Deltaproteobacteria bacterium]
MDFKEVVNTRRAVNLFDPEKSVEQSILRELVETAASAPSGFNFQPWSLIVLEDKEEKLRLQKHAMDQPKVSQAPVCLILLADTQGWMAGNRFADRNFDEMVKTGAMREEKRDWFNNLCQSLYGTDRETGVAFACKNTSFFAMTLMLAARDMGLHTHPMDGFDKKGVKDEFNIPDRYWVSMLIALGYFPEGGHMPEPKWRKTYDEIFVNFNP